MKVAVQCVLALRCETIVFSSVWSWWLLLHLRELLALGASEVAVVPGLFSTSSVEDQVVPVLGSYSAEPDGHLAASPMDGGRPQIDW